MEKVLTKKGRDENTVVLEGNSKEQILADATEFLNSKAWYAERGIPHRRGYLLYGPPGTGKTTFSQVIVHLTLALIPNVNSLPPVMKSTKSLPLPLSLNHPTN